MLVSFCYFDFLCRIFNLICLKLTCLTVVLIFFIKILLFYLNINVKRRKIETEDSFNPNEQTYRYIVKSYAGAARDITGLFDLLPNSGCYEGF